MTGPQVTLFERFIPHFRSMSAAALAIGAARLDALTDLMRQRQTFIGCVARLFSL